METSNRIVSISFALSLMMTGPMAAQGQPSTLTKALVPSAIPSGGTTTLIFTVTNPAGNPAVTNVGFIDALPSGLVVATPPAVGGTCSNAAAQTATTGGGTTIAVSNLNVPAGLASCTVTVNVTSTALNPSCAGNPAAFTNGPGNVTVSNVTNAVVPSCVTIGPVLTAVAVPALSPTAELVAAALLVLIALARLRRRAAGRYPQ